MTSSDSTTPIPSTPSRGRIDRRTLVKGSAALVLVATGAGALTRIAASAQESPSATPTLDDAMPAIVAAANAFLDTLSEDETSSVLFDWSDTEQKQRWSNFPSGAFDRLGLTWGDLGDDSKTAWLSVLKAVLSEDGYNRVIGEWQADDALTSDSGANFGTEFYFIAFIGDPSETDPWQLQFGGHHVTINATIQGSNISLCPSFIGVEPFTYSNADGVEVSPLADIETDAFTLVASLDPTQQSAAVLGDAPIDLVLGPGQDGKTIQPEGLPASQMSADQQASLLRLIGHYTGLVNAEDAVARNAEIAADIADTYFVWYGQTTAGSPAYFRVTGPKIVIEYSSQGDRGQLATNSDTIFHVHGIYRDPTNDYGARFTS